MRHREDAHKMVGTICLGVRLPHRGEHPRTITQQLFYGPCCAAPSTRLHVLEMALVAVTMLVARPHTLSFVLGERTPHLLRKIVPGMFFDVVTRCSAQKMTPPLVMVVTCTTRSRRTNESTACRATPNLAALLRDFHRTLAWLTDHPSSRACTKHGPLAVKMLAIVSSAPRPGHYALGVSHLSVMRDAH